MNIMKHPSGLRGMLLPLLMAACVTPSHATITIQADQEIRDIPTGFGGTGVGSYHRADFRTGGPNGINFLTPFQNAKIKSARVVCYPDFNADDSPTSEELHNRAWFDDNMTWLKNAGVTAPILVIYTDPQPSANAPYYAFNGSTTGGTLGSNIAYFVNRYTSAPYNFPLIYMEVHNEGDIDVDYRYYNPQDYVNRFIEVHNALVANGVRNKVKLCGPVMSRGYYESWTGDTPTQSQVKNELHSKIFDAFLSQCKDIVDVVTWHVYPGNELQLNPDVNALLNAPKHMDGKLDPNRTVNLSDYNQTSMTANRGVAALMKAMDAAEVPAGVRLGITEYNVPQASTTYAYIHRALYNLSLNTFALYTPGMELTTSYSFDDTSSSMNFLSSNAYTKIYWGQWGMNNYLGDVVLQRTVSGNPNSYGNPSLLVSATKDAQYIYVWVVNRTATAISDELVSLSGVPVKTAVNVATLSSGSNPNAVTSTNYGATFLKSFPAYSATFFRFEIDGLLINHSTGFTSGSMSLNQQASISSGDLRLINGVTLAKASAYHTSKVSVNAFTSEFEFSATGTSPADGLTFVIQNAGSTAVGSHGGSLGYVGINKSVAVRLEYWGQSSTGLYTRDAAGVQNLTLHDNIPLSLGNGQTYNVKVVYSGTTLDVTIRNTVTQATLVKQYTVDIPAIVGASTAYVGFTAGSGANTSTISIPYWTYRL